MTETITQMTFHRQVDAKRFLANMQREHGGEWVHEDHRGHHAVHQVKTKEQVQHEDKIREARMLLGETRLDWLSVDCSFSIYRDRDKIKKEYLDEFAKRFAVNPLDAFAWTGTDAIEHGAEFSVLGHVINALDAGETAESISDRFTRESSRIDGYEHLSHSTNPCANLAEQAKRIATRKVSKRLREYVEARRAARKLLEEEDAR